MTYAFVVVRRNLRSVAYERIIFKKIMAEDKRIGNQFWKKRAKHGREKIFKTPKELWDAAVEYFEYTDTRTIDKIDFKGKDNKRVAIPTSVPYTIMSLCIFFDTHSSYWRNFKRECKEKELKDFSAVIKRIEEIIYNQKFEGAAAGQYNANIIARDLGLKDASEIDLKSTDRSMTPEKIDLSKLSDADLKDFLKKTA